IYDNYKDMWKNGRLFYPRSQTPVLERATSKLGFAPQPTRETEFRDQAFPNRSLGTRKARERGNHEPSHGSAREQLNLRHHHLPRHPAASAGLGPILTIQTTASLGRIKTRSTGAIPMSMPTVTLEAVI